MRFKDFLSRYSSFTLAKAALLVGRSAILIFSYGWLPAKDFSVIAGTLSFVEIVRAFTDMGAENIIYSRLSSSIKPLPNIVKNLIKLRFLVSALSSLILFFIGYVFFAASAWPLFLLPLIGSIQNSSVAFMQKNRDFRTILWLVLFVALAALLAVYLVVLLQLKASHLALSMILPESISTLFGVWMTRAHWRVVLTYSKKNDHRFGRLAPYILPSLAISVLVVLYSRLDVVLVLPLLGSVAQADYSIGFRLVEPVYLLLSLASLSLLAELGAYQTAHARLISARLLTVLNPRNYCLSLGLGLGMAFLIRWIAFHYLKLSEGAGWITFFLVLSIPIRLCNTFLTTLLQRGGLYYRVLYAAMIVFAVTLTFGWIFGAYLGVVGIAFASFLAEFSNFMYQKRTVNLMVESY